MKVGVIIPTYKRPDLLRQAVLQWIVQTVKPDVLCINQNGAGPQAPNGNQLGKEFQTI